MSSGLPIRNAMPAAARWWLACAILLLLACTETTTTQAGSSESHFLATCDSACADGLSCLCGVCSQSCQSDDGCRALSPAASCHAPPDALCGQALCDVECLSAGDCMATLGSAARCEQGRCRVPDGQPPPQAGGGGPPPAGQCQTHADCDPDMRCGYPLADGCDAVGQCLSVGMDGDFTVYDQCTRPPGLSPGCIVRASTVRAADGTTMITATHSEAPSAGAGLTCDDQDTGPQSCDVRSSGASQRVAAAIDADDDSCDTDDDCVWASNSSQCFARCGVVLSTAGAAELRAVIEELNDGLCATYEQDCGPVIVPCDPPGDAVCNAGQCTEGF